MPHDHILERQQIIECPLDEVFAFFADAANLQAITPQWLNFEILTPLPMEMNTGALIEYRIRLLGIPMRWKTLIESWQPKSHFVDVQRRGPYALWHHTHTFQETDRGVLMTDRVRYRLPFGPFGRLARKLFVARWLDQIFEYRRKRIVELLPDKTVCT
jgi:ligand-binding SRPBCC domain-containing protein